MDVKNQANLVIKADDVPEGKDEGCYRGADSGG